MKERKSLTSTLFIAAAVMSLGTLPAFAAGDGTSDSPLSGSISGLNPDDYVDSDGNIFDPVYIDGITGGYWAQGSGSDADYALTIEANLYIGDGGMTFTDGYSDTVYTFTGNISGTGDWTHTTSQSQKYIFTGSLSGYSGNITNTGVSSGKETYIHFGDGGTITADTENISGTGSIVVNGNVTFNYTDGDGDDDTSPTMKIGNKVIEATTLEFAGSVNYDVSSDLSGYNSSSTLTISNEGTTTLSGTVSNFSSITVASGSTLVFAGTATIGAIDNSGTVVLNEGVTFTIDGVAATSGSWSSSTTSSSDTVEVTYTLISGEGTVTIADEVLASLGITSSVHAVTGVSFTYAEGVLTAEVTGLADGLHGEGSEENPYYTTGDGTIAIPVSGENSIFTGTGTTVYLATDEWSLGSAAENVYWASGDFTAACNIVIGAAGIYLDNGYSGQTHTFTGAISGEGSWTINSSNVNQDYIFTGDLSGWSGDFTITGSSASYVYFGNGTQAATNTNVTGTGAVSVANGTIKFDYYALATYSDEGVAITIGNSSLTAANIEFAGSVDYIVSEGTTITGTSSSGAFTVSTEGTVTILGTFSDSSTFGSLTVGKNSTLKIGADNTFSIGGATTTFDILGALEIADDVNFTISKSYESTGYSIENLVLGNGSTLTLDTTGRQYGNTSGDVPHESTVASNDQGLAIGTLTVSGSSATISTSTNHNYISIDAIIGENATLNLGNTGQSIAATIYELTGNGESLFTGTISLSDDYEGTNIGYYQGVTLIISDEKVAAGAVIEMGYEYQSNYALALGVNAEKVEIAGLSSDGEGAHIIYSGSISSGANIGDRGAELADYSNHREEFHDVGIDENTLVINVASSESYEFTGNILDKVNIEKKGTGSQSITFQYDKWQTANFFDGSITVTEGTLSLSSEDYVTVTPGNISVAEDATLNLKDITIELSSAIENSGSITISDTTFVLDKLEGGYDATYNVGYYEVVTNSGEVNVELSGNFTFIFGGSTLDDWHITVADNGNVYIYGTVGDLIWAGTDPNSEGGNNNWSTSTEDKTWSAGENFGNTSFINGSGATFGAITDGSPYDTVNVVGEVTASSTTINDSYTFTTNDESGAVLNTGSLSITTGTTSFKTEDGLSLTVNIDGLDMDSSASLEFSGETTNAAITGTASYGNISVTDGAVLDLTEAASANNGNGSLTIIGEGSTVIVSDMSWGNQNGSCFGANMYNNRIQISNGGVLEVTTAQATGTAGRRAFAVTEGNGTYRYSGDGTSYLTNENTRNIHLGASATLIFDVVKSDATLDVSMVIASGLGNDSDVLSSATTSSGSLVKTGEGKLILSGTNLYSGGTKIQKGILEVANSSALGTGTISIEGGQLSISSSVTISNTVNVTFSEAYQVNSSSDTTGFYAIDGSGKLKNDSDGGVEITLFLDEAMMELLISEGELYFALMGTDVQSTYNSDFSISLSDALSSYGYEYYDETGVVRIFLPEPSMFGLLFGLASVGLVATRRRRRKAA